MAPLSVVSNTFSTQVHTHLKLSSQCSPQTTEAWNKCLHFNFIQRFDADKNLGNAEIVGRTCRGDHVERYRSCYNLKASQIIYHQKLDS